MQLAVDIEGNPERLTIPGGSAELVALLSFANSRGFGAEHPLIALAERLQLEHHVRMGPLTTFYEGEIEDAEDAEKLEMAWQEARGLLESVEGAVEALENDEACRALLERAGTPDLPRQLAALGSSIREAAAAGKRVRMSYTL